MIESIEFENFKVLRKATLPLKPFTLIVGPNGSGKSTALQALLALRAPNQWPYAPSLSPEGTGSPRSVRLTFCWAKHLGSHRTIVEWPDASIRWERAGKQLTGPQISGLTQKANKTRIFSLNAEAIAAPVQLAPRIQLKPDGANLAGVLDRLRDQHPARFDALNDRLSAWLPEFDRVLFDTPDTGKRAFMLRTAQGGHPIGAPDLSQGTLLALAILTIAYLPDPPPLIGLEEPDRGIHPRLLRDVRDALYRLSYPDSFGEDREPVQVIATTHSPYFLDLFKDHPEEVVIAHKQGQEATFTRLTDLPDYQEILADSHLGDAWYSGVLGGIPCER